MFDASADGVRRDAMGYGINSVNIHTRYRTYIVGAITDKDRHLSSTSATGSEGWSKIAGSGVPFYQRDLLNTLAEEDYVILQ